MRSSADSVNIRAYRIGRENMDITKRITQHFKDSADLKLKVKDALSKPIADGAQVFFDCVTSDGKILCCGNGGSAADAQHFAAELLNRFEKERPGLACIALTTDSSVLTSIGNDYDFNQIFSKQVRALGLPGDTLLAISTSGNSPNVVAAIHAAHERSMRVIALTGRDGGEMAKALKADDILICVAAQNTARIQEVHLLSLHCICDIIDFHLLGE